MVDQKSMPSIGKSTPGSFLKNNSRRDLQLFLKYWDRENYVEYRDNLVEYWENHAEYRCKLFLRLASFELVTFTLCKETTEELYAIILNMWNYPRIKSS